MAVFLGEVALGGYPFNSHEFLGKPLLLKRTIVFHPSIFGGYVSFRECMATVVFIERLTEDGCPSSLNLHNQIHSQVTQLFYILRMQ